MFYTNMATGTYSVLCNTSVCPAFIYLFAHHAKIINRLYDMLRYTAIVAINCMNSARQFNRL